MRLGVLVMAAGASCRFGACKLLAEINSKPLLQSVIEQVSQLEAKEIVVITGRWHKELVVAQEQGKLSTLPFIYNKDWEKGLGCSIAFGVGHMEDKCDALLITLGDQIAIYSADLQAMINKINSYQIVCAHYHAIRGVPAIFTKDCFQALMELQGDKGAKTLLNNGRYSVLGFDMPDAAIDIDRRVDLTRFIEGNLYSQPSFKS